MRCIWCSCVAHPLGCKIQDAYHQFNTKCRSVVSPLAVQGLVRQYLLYYGYGDTLKAFDDESGATVVIEDMKYEEGEEGASRSCDVEMVPAAGGAEEDSASK